MSDGEYPFLNEHYIYGRTVPLDPDREGAVLRPGLVVTSLEKFKMIQDSVILDITGDPRAMIRWLIQA